MKNFKQAWESSDIDALVGILEPEATAIADGGGLVGAALDPLDGAGRIARFLVEVAGSGGALRERVVNGRPGLVAEDDGAIATVFAFHITGGLARDDVQDVDRVRVCDLAHEGRELLVGVVLGRIRPGVVGDATVVCDAGRLLGELQRCALARRASRCRSYSRSKRPPKQPLVELTPPGSVFRRICTTRSLVDSPHFEIRAAA